MLSFQHNIFHEILTPTVDRRNRIASDIQPIKLSPLEKRIQQTLTNSKDIIQKSRNFLRRGGRARSMCAQANEDWVLSKIKSILGVLWCHF